MLSRSHTSLVPVHRPASLTPAPCCPSRPLQDSILHQLAQEKTLLQPPAAGGTPLLIVKAGRHLPLGDLAELQRFIIYSLEAAAKLCDHASSPDRKLWAIFDLKDLRWANLDRHALSACFSVLTAAFPERVRCIYMLDAPFIFDGLWRVVSPFIDPTTRSKVQFVSGAAGRAALLGTLGAQVLPHTYGGSAEEVPVRQAAQQVQLQWRKQHEGRDGKGGAVAVAAAVPGAAREASLLSDKDAADDADSFVDACEELATVEA